MVTALTLDNDVLAEGLCPREVAAGKSFIDDDDRRSVLIVVLVELASARKGYVERAEVIRTNSAMVRCGLIFGPEGWATGDEESVGVAIAA